MIIDSIKNYLTLDQKKNYDRIIKDIYMKTEYLNQNYPGYQDWFYNKQIKGCSTPNRNIIFIRNDKNEIIALSCLKKDLEEKKICTLFVNSNYRNQGLGTILCEESIKFLETTKPLITFTEDKLPMFQKIATKYDWELTEIIDGIYNNGTREFCFNGKLLKK